MTDKMRSQFEAWHASVVVGEPPHDKYNNGDYRNVHVQRYWIGWQASREALVVDLPSVEENGTLTRGVIIGVLGVVRSTIEALGLKVAP